MKKRVFALAAGMSLSLFLIAQVGAAADSAAVDQQTQQEEVAEQGSQTTPAATLTWQAKEKMRRATKERAAIKRQQEMNKERADQAAQENPAPTTTPDQQTVK